MTLTTNHNKELEDLISFLNKQTEVGACWLEGSHAREENDQYSDIDLWIDCENGKENNLFVIIKTYLDTLYHSEGFVARNFGQDHPEMFQWYIQYSNQVYDIVIQSRTRTENLVFAKNEEVLVKFDKLDIIKWGEEVNPGKYDGDLDVYARWITVKSQVVLNKIERGIYAEVVRLYIKLVEDYIVFLLIFATKNDTANVDTVKKSYSVFKDMYQLDHQTVGNIEKMLQVTSLHEIKSNILYYLSDLTNTEY